MAQDAQYKDFALIVFASFLVTNGYYILKC